MSLQKYRIDSTAEPRPNGSRGCYSDWMGGPSLAAIRNCPAPDIEGFQPRTVYITGEADTYFSVPAACRYAGVTLRGYISGGEDGFEFFCTKHG